MKSTIGWFGGEFMRMRELVVAGCAVVSMCAGLAMSARAEVETDPLVPFSFYRPVPDHLTASARNFDSAPSVTVSPGGRLWIAWHSGGTTEGEDNAVLVATSGDGGKTWSDPLFAIDAPGPLRALDPGLWTDPDGRVWLFYGQVYSYWDGRCGVWATHPIDPEDADTAWTTPVRLCDGFMKNKPIVDSQGRWLLPVEFMKLDPTKGNLGNWSPMTDEHAHPMPEMRAANVFVSTDKGATVSFLGQSVIPTAQMDCMENMVVERGNGTLWMLSRTTYGIGEATSSDGGATWTGTTASTIKNPNSRFFIGRLRSGCLLLVKNGPVDVKTDRNQIMAYVSDDDGATWTGGLTLDAREDVSYPDAAQGDDGFIHVVHDHDRTKTRQIVHHRFTEADVRAGHLVSAGSRLGDTVAVNPSFAPQVDPKGDDEETYALLDYIDSTKGGGQYVDTEFVNANSDVIDLRFDLLSVDPNDYNVRDTPPTSYSMFGARNGDSKSGGATALGMDVNPASGNHQLLFFFCDSTAKLWDARLASDYPAVGSYEVLCDGKHREIIRPDGTSASKDVAAVTFSAGISSYLFAVNVANVTLDWPPHPQMRFRSLTMRRGAETHLFLPVLRERDSKPGVYDCFNSRFLENKGAGADFVAGPIATNRINVTAEAGGRIRVNGGSPTTNCSVVCRVPAVTLTAEPNVGYAFDGWVVTGGAVADPSARTITIPPSGGDVAVSAKFVRPVLVDYIDSTIGGGQYIDTGFVCRQGDDVDLRFDLLSVDPADYAEDPDVFCVFGLRYKSETFLEVGHCLPKPTTTGMFFDYEQCTVSTLSRLSSFSPGIGSFVVHGDGTLMQITNPNGETVSQTVASPAAFSAEVTAYLFHSHLVEYTNAKWRPHPRMRFRTLLIRRGNEDHWFLPARTPEGKPCVYDVWERRLLQNKGTGADFVLGPDCASQGTQVTVNLSGAGTLRVNGEPCGTSLTTNLTIGESIELSALPSAGNAFLRWTSNVDLYDGDTLPAMRLAANPSQGDVSLTAEVGTGITALEYIDSTKGGGQYVDTGFVNKSGDFVDLRFDLLSVDPDDYNSIANPPSTYSMFGARSGLDTSGGLTICQDVNVKSPSVPLVFFIYDGTPSIFGSRITSENPTVGGWRVFSDGTHREIVRPDGTSNVLDKASATFSPDLSAYIFSANLANVSFTWLPHPQMRFRSLLMRRGTEEHLFLPALRGSDSKPGVYDCYNARFLENQGGGADFVASSPDSSIKFGVGVYGEGAVSVNGGTPVSHLTRTVALNAVDLTACPAVADAECVWIGVPANGFRSESGREVAFHEIAARNVYLDVFTPSAADLVVAAGGEKGVSSMSGLRSVHVGTPTAGAGLASFTVLGQVDITAADGGYAVVRTPDGKVKTATFALLNGGRMMLLDDLVVQDIDLPDDKSVLDLNGHVLTIRSKAHKNRAGWAGKVIDSAGGGSVVWKKPGMAILLY